MGPAMSAAAIKTIAVHIPASGLAERLLDAAIPLAQAHDAYLVGAHVLPAVVVYADATVSMSTEFIVAQQEAFQDDAKAVEQAFASRCSAAGIAHELRNADTGDEPTMRAASTACNTADLVVAAQYDDTIPAAAGYSPDELVLGTGRPVLVVPTKGELAPIGKRVLIAWNGSREAARAAFDCLSLLQPGAELRLVSIDSSRGDATLEAMAAALKRRGLAPATTSTTHTEGKTVPEDILTFAEEWNADLIALGCYGHSRLRETVFGGATTRILRDMTRPLLMAH